MRPQDEPTDVRSALSAALGPAFTLGRELGGGGMSRVFMAREEMLERDVVVKVLLPELAQGLSADRFAREMRLAAGLQEPHIVPVLSAGQTSDALPFYTMPFVRGESLRHRMDQGAVPLAEAVSVLRDVAKALAYAHDQGVVHRDIKPENVLLSEGTAVVTDFGIAKAMAAAKTQAPGGTLTQIGTSLGTPAYMAPEQAAGDEVDGRADIYAWAVMAYEMLAGTHPFASRVTAQQLMAAHISQAPRELTQTNPQLPSMLAALVMQCLRKDPNERPADARLLVTALDERRILDDAVAVARTSEGQVPLAPRAFGVRTRRGWTAAIIVALVAGGLFSQRSRLTNLSHGVAGNMASGEAADSGFTRLAVLPFENLGRPEDAYVVDGITDELRGRLSSLPGMRVIARASSNLYPPKGTKTQQQIASELGVQYILTGTLRSEPGSAGQSGRLKVSPELVRIRAGATPEVVWAQSVDELSGDVFQVQAAIATKVAEGMHIALGGSDRARMVDIPTQQPAAYDAFLRGEAQWNAGTNGDIATLKSAAARYETAVKIDPAFVAAWAKLSRANSQLAAMSRTLTGAPDSALATRARFAAQRAMALAPSRAESRRALAASFMYLDRDAASALEAYEPIRVAASGSADVLQGLAAAEVAVGRVTDAIRDARAAQRLDPRSSAFADEIGMILLMDKRVDEARREIGRAVAAAPNSVNLFVVRVQLELATGDLPRAQALVDDEVRLIGPVALRFSPSWVLNDAQLQRRMAYESAKDGPNSLAALDARINIAVRKGDSVEARQLATRLILLARPLLRYSADGAAGVASFGTLLAFTGDTARGIAEGQHAVSLNSYTRDAFNAWPLSYSLAATYMLAHQPNRAIDVLEDLVRHPSPVTPAWLRIDATWGSLRSNPRFQQLIAH